MKILFISGMANRGGTETATARLVVLMKKYGDEVFLASDQGPILDEIKPLLKNNLIVDLYGGPLSYIRNAIKIADFVKNNQIQVIHSQMARPVLACCIARLFNPAIGIVWHSRGLPNSTYPKICRLFNMLKVFAIGNAKQEQDKLKRYGYSEKLVSYTYNPLPKIEAVDQKKKQNNTVQLLSVCRLSPERNVEFALDMLNELINFDLNVHLHIAGSGIELEALTNYAKKLQLEDFVTFHGALNFEQLKELYYQSDIALNTLNLSGDDGAGVGNNNLEAGRFGLPVVAFDSCAVKEIVVNGKTGYCVSVNDEEAFIESVKKLINNSDLRLELGRNLYTHVNNLCSDDEVYRQTIKIYNKALV